MSKRVVAVIVLGWLLTIVACGSKEAATDLPVGIESPSSVFIARVGEALTDASMLSVLVQRKADSEGTLLTISPALPSGLLFDATNARVSGVATELMPATDYVVSSHSDNKVTKYSLTLSVGPQLPDNIVYLTNGFSAEKIVGNAKIPVRMALAEDGRLFYAELQTGNIRIIDPLDGLLSQPLVKVAVVSGMERGVLGLVLDPDFSSNGYLYVNAIVRGHDGEPQHAEIIRYTVSGNSGLDRTVIVDHLPSADIHNGGDLVFDHAGHLFVGRGDVTEPSTAQTDGALSGRVLRYTRDGAIPIGNPYPDSPEWSRGLRNTFALAIHPETGDLFGADAGPVSDDKLNFLQPAKNFLWGLEEEPRGSGVGYSVRVWDEVITPTALLFHRGVGVFADYKNKLFVSSYNFNDIRVVHSDGAAYTDFIREQTFLEFKNDGFSNKPLHMIESADGSIFVSTFDSIYRIY